MDLDPVDKLTTGTVGEPGQRTFFIQATQGERVVTIVVEKEQVELLGTSILEILASVGRETGEGPQEEALELDVPLEPLWRAGRLSIGYAEDRDLMLLELEELVETPGEEEADDDDLPQPARVRMWATREQMFALARHGGEPWRRAGGRSAGSAGTRWTRRATCAPR